MKKSIETHKELYLPTNKRNRVWEEKFERIHKFIFSNVC